MQFSEWITKKYIDWRGEKIGNDGSVTEFAKLFGASHQLLTEWMKKDGRVPRSQKYIAALHKVYGREVLEVLGIQEPETQFVGIDLWPPEVRARLLAAVEETNRTLLARGLTGSSPGVAELIREIFEKYGFNSKSKDNAKSGTSK